MEERVAGSDGRHGYVGSNQQFYDLSVDWYRGRMDADWQPPSAEETAAIFRRHGLTGSFWSLG
jgi:hypothetical protein